MPAHVPETPLYFAEPAYWTVRTPYQNAPRWAPGYFIGENAGRRLSRRAVRRVHKRERRVARKRH